jgi:hypothetical protein
VKEGSGNGAYTYHAGALLGDSGGSFAGNLEGYGEKGSEDGHFSTWGPPWKSLVGCSSVADLGKLWRLGSLSMGVPWNTWGGVRSQETLR